MISNWLLSSQSFERAIGPNRVKMKDSTRKFVELMRERYGPERKAGRGHILNFGEQVSFAIGNSKLHDNGSYFYAVQSDFLVPKLDKLLNPPLGLHAALICESEQTVLVLPQQLVAEAMKNATSDRINIVRKNTNYFLRCSGSPLIEVTSYLNGYPEAERKIAIPVENTKDTIESPEQQQAEIREHTRIQWMLIQFGRAAGCSVWVPTGDKSQEFNGEKLSDLTIPDLPNFGFDAINKQIISNIDVLWLEGNVIHKAFEIESTTSIYSGLLRMSDLVLSQPNINIDLHIVAPSRRRDIVRKNILRPTFSKLRAKCSYIPFEEVTTKYTMVKDLLEKQRTRIRDLLDSETF